MPDSVEQAPVVGLAVELELVDVRGEAVGTDPAKTTDGPPLLQGLVVELLHLEQIGPEELRAFRGDDDAEVRQLDDLLGGGDHGLFHRDRGPPVAALPEGDQQALLAGVLVDQPSDRHDGMRADHQLLAGAGDQPDAVLVADIRPTGQSHRLPLELCDPFQLHLALHGLRPDEGVEHRDEVSDPRGRGLGLQSCQSNLELEGVVFQVEKKFVWFRRAEVLGLECWDLIQSVFHLPASVALRRGFSARSQPGRSGPLTAHTTAGRPPGGPCGASRATATVAASESR